MAHAPYMAVAQNLLLCLMFAPIVAAMAVIAVGVLRRRRPRQSAFGDRLGTFRIWLKPKVRRAPRQIVERSAGGFVRVRPMPTSKQPHDKP